VPKDTHWVAPRGWMHWPDRTEVCAKSRVIKAQRGCGGQASGQLIAIAKAQTQARSDPRNDITAVGVWNRNLIERLLPGSSKHFLPRLYFDITLSPVNHLSYEPRNCADQDKANDLIPPPAKLLQEAEMPTWQPREPRRAVRQAPKPLALARGSFTDCGAITLLSR
jgi:hypothetical protein